LTSTLKSVGKAKALPASCHHTSPPPPLLRDYLFSKTTDDVLTECIGCNSKVVILKRKSLHPPRLSLIVEVAPILEHGATAFEDGENRLV